MMIFCDITSSGISDTPSAFLTNIVALEKAKEKKHI